MLFETQPEPTLAGAAPKGLGRSMTGGGDKVNRRGNDYYPTPPDVTRALLRVERNCIASTAAERVVWEPCGRGGAIMRELDRAGLTPIGTDIVADPANGVEQADLLTIKRPRAKAVVTNPPFAIAAEMIWHLLDVLEVDYLALLLKSSFWHAENRRELFAAYPPARLYALTWRPDFLGGGAPTMECQWCVWQRNWASVTHYHLLPREAPQETML